MNGASAVQLWTIGLCIGLSLIVITLAAIYVYMRQRQPEAKETDFVLEQRIAERLAQIAIPQPIHSRRTA